MKSWLSSFKTIQYSLLDTMLYHPIDSVLGYAEHIKKIGAHTCDVSSKGKEQGRQYLISRILWLSPILLTNQGLMNSIYSMSHQVLVYMFNNRDFEEKY